MTFEFVPMIVEYLPIQSSLRRDTINIIAVTIICMQGQSIADALGLKSPDKLVSKVVL